MNCEKCGSKYILISRTLNNEVVSILCTSCGNVDIKNKELYNKITGGLT